MTPYVARLLTSAFLSGAALLAGVWLSKGTVGSRDVHNTCEFCALMAGLVSFIFWAVFFFKGPPNGNNS